jgi:hypothetical protein
MVLLGPASGGLAQTDGAQTDGGDGPTAVLDDALREPAVVVPEQAAEEGEAAWTFRFLIPTLLAGSGLALAAIAVLYGVGVKARFRVVR